MAWERKGRVLQAEDAYNTKGAPQDPDFQGKVMRLQFPVGVPKRIKYFLLLVDIE